MKLNQFKKVKNRQRPELCYSYVAKIGEDTKYSIFTMNAGKSFLASVDQMREDGRYYSEFSQTFSDVESCLEAFSEYSKD